MKDLLVAVLAEPTAEVREGGATRDAIVAKPGKDTVVLPQRGIAQDGPEVFAVSGFVEIAAEVENGQRDRIVAGRAEDGIGVGGDGPYKMAESTSGQITGTSRRKNTFG